MDEEKVKGVKPRNWLPIFYTMSLDDYDEMRKILDGLRDPSVAFQKEDFLKEKYPHVPLDTLASINQYHYSQRTRKCHFLLRNKGDNMYYKFLQGLERKKECVAFNLAMNFRQPPYLVSQLLLQKHFAKQWEDERKQQAASTPQSTPSQRSNKRKGPNTQLQPWQLSFKQDFPSLRENKQKRVTPIPLNSIPSIRNSPMKLEQKPRPSVTSTPLSLSDVMVIKTKKNKKSSQSNKSKETNQMMEKDSKVLETIIQDKDKNKLFDRILNKGKSKESGCLDKEVKNNNDSNETLLCGDKMKFSLKSSINPVKTGKKEKSDPVKQVDNTVDNANNCNASPVTRVTPNASSTSSNCNATPVTRVTPNASSTSSNCNATPVTRVTPNASSTSSNCNATPVTRVTPNASSTSSNCNATPVTRVTPNASSTSSNCNATPVTRVTPNASSTSSNCNATPVTRVTPNASSTSSNCNATPVTRVTPLRLETPPHSNPEHQLSSIHFMTQNCQSKEELYEDYRYKLQRLSERFTKQLKTDANSPVTSDGNKQPTPEKNARTEKPVEVKRKFYKIRLNTLDESERKKALVDLIQKVVDYENGTTPTDPNKPQEVLSTPYDYARWKTIVQTYRDQPEVLVEKAAQYWNKFYGHQTKTVNGPKEFLKLMLRDPSLIKDPILSKEISYNNAMDDQYGPIRDLHSRSLGVQHEQKLEDFLTQCRISYKSEKLCMSLGFDKTPDILVWPTLYISGFPVNWIESKALFGNPHNHALYEKNQYEPYYQRFGSGCVIYWFGHVETLVPKNDMYVILAALPPPAMMTQPSSNSTDSSNQTNSSNPRDNLSNNRCNSKTNNENDSAVSKEDNMKVIEHQTADALAFIEKFSALIQIEFEKEPESSKKPRTGKSPFRSPYRHQFISPGTLLSNQFDSKFSFPGSPRVLFRPPDEMVCSTPVRGQQDGFMAPRIHGFPPTENVFQQDDPSPETSFSDSFMYSIMSDSNSNSSCPLHSSCDSNMSLYNCSSNSMCSMCDTSFRSECNSFSCAKVPPCFSAQCSDKLLSYTSPCTCDYNRRNAMNISNQ